jgi:hypothetical protein
LNFGKPLVFDEFAGGFGAGGTVDEIQNLRAIRQTLAGDVRAAFRSIYGDDPTDHERERWTNTIIRLGNRLQRHHGLEAGAAGGRPRLESSTASSRRRRLSS